MAAISRVLAWAFAIGAVGFVTGFFGPLIVAPDANQGPLLGIFITGPLGVVVGFAVGVVLEMSGARTPPLELLSRIGLLAGGARSVLRGGAALLAIVLLVNGLSGLRRGEGRGAAASIVVGAALAWYAIAGRAPGWFRR